MDLSQIRRTAAANLESAEAELEALQQRVEELRIVVQGLDLAEKLYSDPGVVPPTSDGNKRPDLQIRDRSSAQATSYAIEVKPAAELGIQVKTEIPQSDLCLAALKDFDQPVSSAQIRERLNHQGYEFNAEQIRGAMAYLLRKDRVVRTSPGMWAVPEQLQTLQNGVNGQFTSNRNY